MQNDYAQPSTRAKNGERSAMRQIMAMAHSSFTTSSMNGGESVEVFVDFDMSVFGEKNYSEGSRRQEIERVVFDSCFARFRAEGRYGEMSMTFKNSGTVSYRDTY